VGPIEGCFVRVSLSASDWIERLRHLWKCSFCFVKISVFSKIIIKNEKKTAPNFFEAVFFECLSVIAES
jgi:hypothetical protein